MATDQGTGEESPSFIHLLVASLYPRHLPPLGHAHSRAFRPITAESPHTLKPLTSNQPWRPNGVLYGRHWANAACTRASPLPPFPSPPLHLPSVPAAIWLTPHQHPSSPHPYICTQQTCICTGTHIQNMHRGFYLP